MPTSETGLSYLDGQGDLDNQERGDPISSPRSQHRYIYYRLYSKDGPLESYHPIYSNEQFISRTLSKSIAPPRTADSLKKYLCKIEGFQEPGNCSLYLSLAEKTPVEDSSRLALQGESGPGSSEFEPVALVVDMSWKRSTASTKAESKKLDEWPEGQARRYVYYRVYNEDGEAVSKTSFDDNDTCLGRVDTLSIPPPNAVSSLKRRLIKAEGFSGRKLQLFEDDDGETIMNDGDALTFHADTYYPGVTGDNHIALVSKICTNPQPRRFSKKLKANAACTMAQYDTGWHSTMAGEIFKTDGVLTTKQYYHSYTYHCYVAINASGKKAFIQRDNITFC